MKTLKQEIYDAYADRNRGWEVGQKIRNLDFKASGSMTLFAWEEAMSKACPNGYGEFDTQRVSGALAVFREHITIIAAREGSVAVYVKCTSPEIAKQVLLLSQKISADEANIYSGNIVRFWWD